MKKILILAAILFFGAEIFASSFTFQEESYSGKVSYNSEAKPGEAIFARLSFKFSRNAKRKSQGEIKGIFQLYSDGKKIESANFYSVSQKKKSQNSAELLSGIPLSSWLESEKNYALKIIVFVNGEDGKEMSLPFEMKKASFVQETIDLDERNTGIKQNMSGERLKQIEKLNALLGTVNQDSVYSLKPFSKPVESERMTAHFGDRRTYRYVNGKTETSLHYGDDYGVPEGTEVRACQEGKVVMAEFRISTGWSVVIEHLPGLYSLYYHLKALEVNEGDIVKNGEKIGLSGSTGLATGPHLHWEVRLNMCAVKPDFFRTDYTFEGLEN